MSDNFGNWLRQQRELGNLTQADLARASKLSRGIINKIENGISFPTSETIRSIAIGLKMTPAEVFRAAGLLPSVPKGDEQFEKLTYLFTELPAQKKIMLLEYAQFLLSNVEKN